MSFRDEEIAAEFDAASGMGREFFDRAGHSFGRLGRVERLDPKLVNALYWRKWRAENPERARAYVSRYAKTEKGRTVAKAKKRRGQQKNRAAYNAGQRAAYARRKARRAA